MVEWTDDLTYCGRRMYDISYLGAWVDFGFIQPGKYFYLDIKTLKNFK